MKSDANPMPRETLQKRNMAAEANATSIGRAPAWGGSAS
jgi:hypothetical protein